MLDSTLQTFLVFPYILTSSSPCWESNMIVELLLSPFNSVKIVPCILTFYYWKYTHLWFISSGSIELLSLLDVPMSAYKFYIKVYFF